MATDARCETCAHYSPYDGGLDVNDNGDVVGGSDSDRGQCFGMEATIEVKCTDVCPHWKGQMSHRSPSEKARLEAAVVKAALAERRAGRYLRSRVRSEGAAEVQRRDD